MSTLLQIRWNFYLTDVLDIFIIATLLYSLFVFFRKTRTSMIFLGLSFTAVLYIMARFFNLYLTLLVLRYFVGVSLVLFVIIFQNEIRKYFEFIGVSSTRQLKSGKVSVTSPTITQIIQACVQMAQSKTGALIVIHGEDNIDPFIDGGTELDGIISEELLLSIFDPSSDGHDGAMIINNNRVVKFGAHLPLSTNFKDLGKKGTRHSAALGLSEVTDALCIVVSEEKGHISICRDGKIKTLSQFTELEKWLTKYIKDKFNGNSNSAFVDFFKKNTLLKIIALIFASVIWYFVAYQAGIVQKTYNVPITFDKLPENVLVENLSPKEVAVTVSGRGEVLFKNITPENFKIVIDGSTLQNGLHKKALTLKNVSIPPNLSLVKYDPESILLTSTKYKLVEVPVNVLSEDKNAEKSDNPQKSIVVTPDSVELWVPESMEAPTQIETEKIDVTDISEPVIVPVKVIVPDDMRLVNGNSSVNVAVTLESISE